MFYVYILKSRSTQQCYIGYTEDLRRRLAEHSSGRSTYTKDRGPFELTYYEAYRVKSDALRRERKLKQFKKGLAMLKTRIMDSLDSVV